MRLIQNEESEEKNNKQTLQLISFAWKLKVTKLERNKKTCILLQRT